MKIALIDEDNAGRRNIAFPNLPLMKISAYHKARGDSVEWWCPLRHYDVAYRSCIFDYSPDSPYEVMADNIIEGGTGYGHRNKLPNEIEHIMAAYSLYPQFKEAYGFLTRGCPRKCAFCIVSAKEGPRSIQVADLAEFWSGQKCIKLLDPNLLACAEHEELLQQLIDSRAWVDFTQGLDIRLVNEQNTDLIRRVKVKQIHFAWDNPHEDLTEHFKRFKRRSGIADYRKLGVYVLTNYDSTFEEDLCRIYTLRDLGYSPYVMIYEKQSAPRRIRLLQRWVNNRIIFGTVKKFEDYDARIG